MTLPRLDAITAHWDQVPPLAVSVAAIASVLGVTRDKKATPAKVAARDHEADDAKARELMQLLGGVGFSSEKPAWLTTQT